MSGLRTSKVSRMTSMQWFRTQRLRQAIDMPEDDGVIRILVLDHERETLERLKMHFGSGQIKSRTRTASMKQSRCANTLCQQR